MQSINVISLAPDVTDWLAISHHPRILNVFDHACNLINERGEVLSIVTQEIGNGPFNLVIEDDVLFSDHLDVQSRISNSPIQLNLGNLTINTTSTKFWSPRPDWETLHTSKDNVLDQLMKLPITNYLRSGGFDTVCLEYTGLLNHQNLPIAQTPISNSLISALTNADLTSSLAAAQQLAGLGQGLTPAGDDFILGAVLAAWIIHPSYLANMLANEITKIAAPLTTSLSAAWLRSAGKGDAGILWHNFFNALISADEITIQKSMKQLLAVGHTSGADALSGFIDMMMSCVKVPSKSIQIGNKIRP